MKDNEDTIIKALEELDSYIEPFLAEMETEDATIKTFNEITFNVGDRVEHVRFGKGEVVSLHQKIGSFLVKFDGIYPTLLHNGNGSSEYISDREDCWWFTDISCYPELTKLNVRDESEHCMEKKLCKENTHCIEKKLWWRE